mgnify:CR=1 FL=1
MSVRRSNHHTRHFADDKPNGDGAPKNHTADAPRTMRKLKELLCERGYRTSGEACFKCESSCRFGEEYAARQKEGDNT